MHTSQSSIYENGKVNGILGIVRDVTERKKAEEKLKESEEKYRKLFESAQDGILIINTETGRITDANPFIEKLLGYNKNEFVGKQIFEISLKSYKERSTLDIVIYLWKQKKEKRFLLNLSLMSTPLITPWLFKQILGT